MAILTKKVQNKMLKTEAKKKLKTLKTKKSKIYFFVFHFFCGKHIFKEEWLIYTKYIAAVFFATMAVSKIIALHN